MIGIKNKTEETELNKLIQKKNSGFKIQQILFIYTSKNTILSFNKKKVFLFIFSENIQNFLA